jgi:hypothetical protein
VGNDRKTNRQKSCGFPTLARRTRSSRRNATGRNLVASSLMLEKLEEAIHLLKLSQKPAEHTRSAFILKHSASRRKRSALCSRKGTSLGFKRTALHAFSITFTNLEDKKITVTAPLPADFKKALKELHMTEVAKKKGIC